MWSSTSAQNQVSGTDLREEHLPCVLLLPFMFWHHLSISAHKHWWLPNIPSTQVPEPAFCAYMCVIEHWVYVRTDRLRMNWWRFFSHQQRFLDFANPAFKCNAGWLFILLKWITLYECCWWDKCSVLHPNMPADRDPQHIWAVSFEQILGCRCCEGLKGCTSAVLSRRLLQ